jgi:hypothetical protein
VQALKWEARSLREFHIVFAERSSFKPTLRHHKIDPKPSYFYLLEIEGGDIDIHAIRNGSPLLDTFRESSSPISVVESFSN